MNRPNDADGPSSPEGIRNVVMVGASGAGKTALFEKLVAARIPGRRSREGELSATLALAAAAIPSGEVTINLLDTPGHPDFVGDVRAGLRAADAALFVVSAAEGVDEPTRLLWRECEAVGMPRAVAVTRLEQARADFDGTVDACQRAFGDAEPLALPLLEDGVVRGILNLLRRTVTDRGRCRARHPQPPATHRDRPLQR
jgi:elongation factor G